MIVGSCPRAAKTRSRPTAVITELSMMPMGGKRKPVMRRPILAIRQIQKGIVFLRCEFFMVILVD
jgi:hypothetical protein